MTIKRVWQQVNVSTLLVLPIFDSIVEGVRARHPHIEFPFILLAYEYGLISSYLFTKEDFNLDTLRVVFSEKVLTDLKLVDSDYFCLADRIIDSGFCQDISRDEDKVIFNLEIPEHIRNDIRLITKGKYSKVSKYYRSLLKIKQKNIPKWTSEIGSYIARNDLPYSVVSKRRHLKEKIVDRLRIDIPPSNEFYTSFRLEKETFHSQV